MTEAELRRVIRETLDRIKKLRAASQTHPIEAMRESCEKRMQRAEEELDALMRELDASAPKPDR
jgi:hypothetical protein